MIRLTKNDGTALYISAEHVSAVEFVNKGEGETWLYTVDNTEPAIVTESPEEVARKVLEYRLAMVQYETYLTHSQETNDWSRPAAVRKLLSELAGLEEQKDE